jgi:hypothetical protein
MTEQEQQNHMFRVWVETFAIQRHKGANDVWIFAHDFSSCMTARGDASSCFDATRDIVMPPVSPTLQAIHWAKNEEAAAAAALIAASNRWTAYFRGTFEWRWHGRKDGAYSKVIATTKRIACGHRI